MGIEVIRMDQVANEGPVLTNVGPQQVPENGSLSIQINAADGESDAITLQSSTLPSFVTFVDQGNGTGTLTANPTAADVGSYPISVQAQAGDQPLTDETAFILAVDDVFSDVSGMMGGMSGG